MEIDELKQLWQHGALHATSSSEFKIVTGKPNQGPLATLKRKTVMAIGIFPLVALLFAGTFYDHPAARQSAAMWLLLGILFVEFVFSLYNLAVINKLQHVQGNIRENVTSRINILKRSLKLFLNLYVSLYVLMAVLLEITMHYQLDGLFAGWLGMATTLRVFTYIVLVMLIYYAKSASQREHYGKHLTRLKEIASQIE